MKRFAVVALLLLCAACGNSSKDNIIDSFNGVKLSQKIPDDIATAAQKKVMGDTVSYTVDLTAGNELFLGNKVNNVNYRVKGDKVEGIFLNIPLTSNDADEKTLTNMISKFGDPGFHCKSMIVAKSNPNVFLGMDGFRWKQGAKVLSVSLMWGPNNKTVISIGIRTESLANANDKENEVDCEAFVRPKNMDKSSVGLWQAIRGK